jgi:peptidoglycan/xylan/chitin deacetylase (PgdA/CDA1 family)
MKNVLEGLRFILSSRRLSRLPGRLRTAFRRFGATPARQLDILKAYVDFLEAKQVPATFFIPAILLERYADVLRPLQRPSVEWGIHGYTHTDMSRLSPKEQARHIHSAISVFDACHVPFHGFRAPYLRENGDTNKILAQTGRFLYNSSISVLRDDVYASSRPFFQWAKRFYKPRLFSRGHEKNQTDREGPVVLPVTLPDDDILCDRQALAPREISSFWQAILHSCHERDELFVLQLHPERFLELSKILAELVDRAQDFSPPVFVTTLSGAVQRLKDRAFSGSTRGIFCLTGDIDALCWGDFFQRLKQW